MKIQIFGSSSAGNCIRVFNDQFPGVYLDAGVNPTFIRESGSPLANRPVLVTHEHGDHAKYAKVLADRYNCPIIASKGTLDAIGVDPYHRILVDQIKYSYDSLWGVKDYPIVHYPAADPRCFVIALGNEKLLYMVDCGQAPDQEMIPDCDIYFVEANYTPERLKNNNEQWAGVRGRTSSGFGHMSALDAFKFLEHRVGHAKKIILGHVSKNNFDMSEYMKMVPLWFHEKVVFARQGLVINTDPF